MMTCWAQQPDDRPYFDEIVTTIYNYTEVITGYHDISFNPFKSTDNLIDVRLQGAAGMAQNYSRTTELLERQLDHNKMLIPYTMLILKECVGQGMKELLLPIDECIGRKRYVMYHEKTTLQRQQQ